MDPLATLGKVLELRWDAPYRLVASGVAVAAAVGLFLGFVGPLEVLAGFVDWLGWLSGGHALMAAHSWLASRSSVVGWVGIVVLVAGSAFAYRGHRGGATAMVGVAFCSEAGSVAPVVVALVLILGAVVARIAWRIEILPPSWFWETFYGLAGAFAYVVAAPFRWALLRS